MNKEHGFTLIELLITVVLAAIVMMMGVPSFSTMVGNNRLITQTNEFIGVLNLTRSEAVKRRTVATLCVEQTSGGSSQCDTANGRWETGWVVFVDADSDGVIDADEVVRRGVTRGGNKLRSVALNNPGRLQYDSRGRVDDNGTFVLCDHRGVDHAHVININGVGRASVADDQTDVEGNAITCPTS